MRILAGRFKGRALPVPEGARPAGSRLRTSLFGVLGARVEGARVLDVCAGAGGLGLEALSRGALHVTLVDRDGATVRGLNAWLERVGAPGEGQALRLEALRQPWPPGPYDLVFLDPPFAAWERGDGPAWLQRAREVVREDGLLVVKCPTPQALPEGGGWRLRDRRAAGDSAFVLLAPVADP